MIMDQELLFSDNQSITAEADATNVIDLETARNIGVGEDLYIALTVTETFDDGSDNSTLTVSLVTDDNEAMSSDATIQTLVVLPATCAAGTQYFFKLPVAVLEAYQRYITLHYTPANGDLSAGKITAGIVKDIQKWTAYPIGFTVA